jgi:hypothetical protein
MRLHGVGERTAVAAKDDLAVLSLDVYHPAQLGERGCSHVGASPHVTRGRSSSHSQTASRLAEQSFELFRRHPLGEHPDELRQHGDVCLREQTLGLRRHFIDVSWLAAGGSHSPLLNNTVTLERHDMSADRVVRYLKGASQLIHGAAATPQECQDAPSRSLKKSVVPTCYRHDGLLGAPATIARK